MKNFFYNVLTAIFLVGVIFCAGLIGVLALNP